MFVIGEIKIFFINYIDIYLVNFTEKKNTEIGIYRLNTFIGGVFLLHQSQLSLSDQNESSKHIFVP